MKGECEIGIVSWWKHHADSQVIEVMLSSARARTVFAIVSLFSACAMSMEEPCAFGLNGKIDVSTDSACVSKGRTIHDAPVTCMRGFLSDFRIVDTTIPAFVGCIGKLSISDTDRYPEETPGEWVEIDPTAGLEWSRYVGLEDDMRLVARWFRWTFPATCRAPSDAAILDATVKTLLNPTASLWYRFHGPTKGRFEVLLSASEECGIWDELKAFGTLNAWFVDSRNECGDRESGANAGELVGGLSWRCFYVKSAYWFQLDRRVLSGDNPTYDYDKQVIFSVGMKLAF